MAQNQQAKPRKHTKINTIAVTSEQLTSRGGLVFFAQYLENLQILPYLTLVFGCIRKSAKGQSLAVIFKQILCFLMDGSSRHLVYFDQLQKDEGYAASLELQPQEMLSSHSVKRFFKAFSMPLVWCFRPVLHRLFLWRLRLEQPKVIFLGMDSMVMDNAEAQKRDGVQPTYKHVNGFHPLQMTWNHFLIDALFRGGKKHCNHGDSVARMVRKIVKLIREEYREDVAIILLLDSGFFDEKLFRAFEHLGIGYICNGKLYGDLSAYEQEIDQAGLWEMYRKGKETWTYFDFEDKRDSWSQYRRALICRHQPDSSQALFDPCRPVSMLYTNLGMGEEIDAALKRAGRADLCEAEAIIESAHGRGRDELVHRALKDFACQTLPFQRFAPNAAYYYTLILAHFLYECFKEDVCREVIPLGAYASTVRRKLIDIAAKIVRSAGRTMVKFTQAAWDSLNLEQLWQRCHHPPLFA